MSEKVEASDHGDGPFPRERYVYDHTSIGGGAAGAALSIAPVILSTRLAFLQCVQATVERQSCQAVPIRS